MKSAEQNFDLRFLATDSTFLALLDILKVAELGYIQPMTAAVTIDSLLRQLGNLGYIQQTIDSGLLDTDKAKIKSILKFLDKKDA